MDAEIEVDSAEDPNVPSLTPEVGQNGAVHLHVQPGILPTALYIYLSLSLSLYIYIYIYNVCYYYSAASFAPPMLFRDYDVYHEE